MSVWTLDINGTESPLNVLGIEQFELSLLNIGEDTLILNQIPVALSTPASMQYADEIQLIEYINEEEPWETGTGIIRFIGIVTTAPLAGFPSQKQSRQYIAKNICWQLNRVIYEQNWHEDEITTYYKGRVKLGKDLNDSRTSIGAAILDIINFAQSQGLSLAYETADLDAMFTIPPDSEFIDITCFEAIKNLLNWSPSVSTMVDYTAGTPKIRFIKRSAATVKQFTATQLQALSLTPRHDLLLDGVVINYEILNQIEGSTYTTAVQDSAGSVSGLNVLKQTIDLYGMESAATEQRVDILTSAMPPVAGETFFKKYIPGLGSISNITLTNNSNTSALPRILEEGTVPEWTNKTTEEAVVSATLSGTLNGIEIENVPIAVNIILTDAETKTYTQLTSATYTPPEDVPVGLAQRIYEERSVLHYQGSFTQKSAEPPFLIYPADVCNLLPGGAPNPWDDGVTWDESNPWLDTSDGILGFDEIQAMVESVRILRTARYAEIQVNIGPPRHLQAQDFIALARASRKRVTSEWSRKEPSAKKNGAVHSGGGSPGQNGAIIGGALPSTAGKSAAMGIFLESVVVEGQSVLVGSWKYPTYSA